MKQVNIIIDSSRIVDYLIDPIRKNIKTLKLRGYSVTFHHSINQKTLCCDFLLLVSKAVFGIVNEKEVIISEESPTMKLLIKARQYAGKIIWLDSSDSTTVTHFELLPFVDLYLKKQLLKDKKLYQKNFLGGRIFTDFYHNNFDVKDDVPFNQFYPLNMDYKFKLDLSWNIGLGNMYTPFSKINKLRLMIPNIISYKQNIIYTSPSFKREVDVFIRTTSNLDRNSVAFHRKELLDRLNTIIFENDLSGSTKGKWLSTKEFKKKLQATKILPSPFGWGELGVRDYEAFIHGAMLLKPSMAHMETWPPIFIENETYIPFNWDFSDLNDKISYFIKHEKERIYIAENGQNAYKKSISEEGMNAFSNWFISKINK
jgi:hypothetical protein